MMEKNVNIVPNPSFNDYLNKMKNRLYGLLCEKEKKGEWEKFLDTILIELFMLNEELKTSNYYALFYKLSALKFLSYEYFRKTVFECMNLINRLGDRDEVS